ncbi:hypothetical protein [Nannocystis pusilla]|uniref:hypothetical protein n=1 Tax=Nannocystis pusilla TaxID=889268 RepID=UPI003B7F1D02
MPDASEAEAEHVPSDTPIPGANRREPARRLGRPDESRLADAFAKVAAEEASELRLAADEPAAPRSWTTGPLQRLTANASELQRALQQVAGETAAADPWTISLQARAEPNDDRALALLRAGLEQFPGDRTLSLDLVERLTEAPTKQSVRSALSTIAALLEADSRDKLTLAHLVLLLAWTGQFLPPATLSSAYATSFSSPRPARWRSPASPSSPACSCACRAATTPARSPRSRPMSAASRRSSASRSASSPISRAASTRKRGASTST